MILWLILWLATSIVAGIYLRWWWKVDTMNMGERAQRDFMRQVTFVIVPVSLVWPISVPMLWVTASFWPSNYKIYKEFGPFS